MIDQIWFAIRHVSHRFAQSFAHAIITSINDCILLSCRFFISTHRSPKRRRGQYSRCPYFSHNNITSNVSPPHSMSELRVNHDHTEKKEPDSSSAELRLKAGSLQSESRMHQQQVHHGDHTRSLGAKIYDIALQLVFVCAVLVLLCFAGVGLRHMSIHVSAGHADKDLGSFLWKCWVGSGCSSRFVGTTYSAKRSDISCFH